MFCLVVLLEVDMGYCDLSGDDEVMSGRIKRPKIGTKNPDAERDILGVRVVLHHVQFERIGKIFANTHV